MLEFIGFSLEQKPIEIMELKLCNVDEIYPVSRIWADSEQKDEDIFVKPA